jgi:virulence-associated protein VagC
MSRAAHSKVFWSGGSQAVRVPKALRLPEGEVTIERRGKGLLIVPVEQGDDWAGFWDQLLRLKSKVRRYKTRPAERRKPL